MYKFDRTKLPCKFEQTWWEDVVGDGGPRMQMFDCTCDKELTPGQVEIMSNISGCYPQCPVYEPVEVHTCAKHGEYIESCGGCEEEAYNLAEKE